MRAPNRRGLVRGTARLAILTSCASVGLLIGCGGGEGASAVGSGVSLRAVWQRALLGPTGNPRGFDGSSAVPPSVGTIEVRVSPSGVPATRVFVEPTGASVRVNGIVPGIVTVQLLGYDVEYAQRDEIVAQALPPSFASGPKSVQIAPYAVTNAGVFELFAQPFVTEFVPLPGATGVGRLAPVEFVIATAAGAIEENGINVDVDGLAIVRAGVPDPNAGLIACDDRSVQPCSAGGDKNLVGFRFFYDPQLPYPPEAPVGVFVSAVDSQGQAVEYSYGFSTTAEATAGGAILAVSGSVR